MREAYPVVVMRGGSSRALVFRGEDLPAEVAAQDRIFLAALGCPDPTGRQVDGLGGGASSNNKVAIVAPSPVAGVEVDYTFGQLSPDRGFVDRAGTCGNIAAAIGPFAIEAAIVAARDGVTPVTIRNTNSDRRLLARVPTPGGRFDPEGEFEIAGVPGSGARIELDFLDPGGSAGRGLLPSGRPQDLLAGNGPDSPRCSLVDAAKPGVLVPFSELGLEPGVRPEQLDADRPLLERIEAVRAAGAVAIGIAADADAAAATPSLPQLTFFAPAGPGSLRVLGISMGKAHRSLPLTAAICLAAAATVPGTLVAEAVGAPPGSPLVLLHPAGSIEVEAALAAGAGEGPAPELAKVTVARTARRLFAGEVYV